MKKTILTFLLFIGFNTLYSQEQSFTSEMSALSEFIQNLETSKLQINQSIANEENIISLGIALGSNKSEKSKKKLYEFSFSDIDVNTVRYEISKDIIRVFLKAKNNEKIIKYSINNEKQSYINGFFVYAKDIDNARDLTSTIKKIIPLSENITQNRVSLSSYKDHSDWLKDNVSVVEILDKSFGQNLTTKDSVTGSMMFLRKEPKKTDFLVREHEFNFSSIDTATIAYKSVGSYLVLNLDTKSKAKIIKYIENGTVKGYVNNFNILCKNAENCKDLRKVIKSIIPLATTKITKSIPEITSVAEGVQILNAKIKEVQTNQNSINQSLTENYVTALNTIENTSKDTIRKTFDFNFIDLDAEKIDIEVKGKDVLVKTKVVENKKFVKYIKNGVQQNYANQVVLYCNGMDDAIISKEVLRQVIELSKKGYKIEGELQKEVKNVLVKNFTVNQTMENFSKSNLRYTRDIIKAKGKSEKNVQEFNLLDIDPKSIKTKVSGDVVVVEFLTKNLEKTIKTYLNGETRNYTNKVLIYCNSLENARVVSNDLERKVKNVL